MNVVKVGDYYVKNVKGTRNYVRNNIFISEIVLSNEIMRGYDLDTATQIAKKINGIVVEIADNVTMGEEKYKQLSLFDKEVQNNANT